MIDTVLFDFDGTVMDTTGVILASWQLTFRTFRGEEADENMLFETFGEPLELTMRKFFPDIPQEEALAVYQGYQRDNFLDEIRIFPGMREAIKSIRDSGRKTALVTSRLARTTHEGLKAYDLYPLFDAVFTVEDCEEHKPAPGPALNAMKALGSRPENTMMLGDTRFDIQCATNAGVKAVLVGWTVALDPEDLPEDVRPDAVLERPEDLLSLAESF